MNNGYIEIMMPEHPNARSNGTILEHRLVAEIPEDVDTVDFKLTFELPDKETVESTKDE